MPVRKIQVGNESPHVPKPPAYTRTDFTYERILIGTFIATIFALVVVGGVHQAVVLWPVSGVALALSLPSWHRGRKARVAMVASAAAGFLIAAGLIGMPMRIASMIAVLTCVDVAIGTSILWPHVKTFEDLKYQKNILRLLTAVVLGPLITGSIGTYLISNFLNLPALQTWMMNVFSNSLGMAVVVPAILLLLRKSPSRPRTFTPQARQAAGAAILFLAVCGYVFWQSANPFLFLIFPAMILVLLTMGLEGSVFISIAVSAIGWFGTSHHHGPICLARGSSPLQEMLTLQGYALICIATALSVGALLDERERADHSARESQSIYQVLLQNAEDLIVLSSLDGSNRYVSPAILRLTGWTPQEYLALDRFETLHPEDQDKAREIVSSLTPDAQERSFRYRMKQKGGSWIWVEATVRAYGVQGEQIAGYVGTVRDISKLKKAEENWRQERRQMADLANTDPLTGLLNRRGFDEKMRQQQSRHRLSQTILMIDVDYFKSYNDTYGHQLGDDCLVQIAAVLRSQAARGDDVIARMGGEEFAVALLGVDPQRGMAVAEKIRLSLHAIALKHASSPFGVVTLSVGVAAQSESAEPNIKRLLAQADEALYLSKRKRDCTSVYDKDATRLTA